MNSFYNNNNNNSADSAERAEQLRRAHEKIKLLPPGALVDLQFTTPLNVRIRSTLVGYEKGRFLIIKQPDGRNYHDVLVEGNVAVMRFVVEGEAGECIACKAPIRSILNFPSRLLFLDYPQHVENRQLRAQKRIATHILASMAPMSHPEESKNGLICDISPSGCRIRFRSESMVKGVNKVPVFIGIGTGQQNETIQIRGEVMNHRREGDHLSVGIKFTDNTEQVTSALEKLLIDTDLFSSGPS